MIAPQTWNLWKQVDGKNVICLWKKVRVTEGTSNLNCVLWNPTHSVSPLFMASRLRLLLSIFSYIFRLFWLRFFSILHSVIFFLFEKCASFSRSLFNVTLVIICNISVPSSYWPFTDTKMSETEKLDRELTMNFWWSHSPLILSRPENVLRNYFHNSFIRKKITIYVTFLGWVANFFWWKGLFVVNNRLIFFPFYSWQLPKILWFECKNILLSILSKIFI